MNNDTENSGNADQKPDYVVGYRRPPKATQFKPGQSGHRQGRPKGHKNFKTILTEQLRGRMEVKVDGKVKKVTRAEALFMLLTQKALQGDFKAIDRITALARTYNVGVSVDVDVAIDADEVNKTEKILIESYKQQWLSEQSAPAPAKKVKKEKGEKNDK